MSIEAIKKALECVTPGPWDLCAHLKDNDACSCGYRGVIYGPEPEGFAICQPGHEPAPEGQEGTEPPRYSREVEIANMRYIAAVNPAAVSDLISEIDRLQRENAELKAESDEALDDAKFAERIAAKREFDAIARAEAAEAEIGRLQTELALSKPLYSRRQTEARVKLLEEALKPFADLAPSYDPPEDDDDHKCWHAESTPTLGDLRRARTVLASTGGEHHAE